MYFEKIFFWSPSEYDGTLKQKERLLCARFLIFRDFWLSSLKFRPLGVGVLSWCIQYSSFCFRRVVPIGSIGSVSITYMIWYVIFLYIWPFMWFETGLSFTCYMSHLECVWSTLTIGFGMFYMSIGRPNLLFDSTKFVNWKFGILLRLCVYFLKIWFAGEMLWNRSRFMVRGGKHLPCISSFSKCSDLFRFMVRGV